MVTTSAGLVLKGFNYFQLAVYAPLMGQASFYTIDVSLRWSSVILSFDFINCQHATSKPFFFDACFDVLRLLTALW